MDNRQVHVTRATDFSDEYNLAVIIPFLVVGTLGNTLTLCVLQRPFFKDKSFAVFLRSLAVADTGSQWLSLGTIQIFSIGRTTMRREWEYRIQIIFYTIFSLASSWTIVLVHYRESRYCVQT